MRGREQCSPQHPFPAAPPHPHGPATSPQPVSWPKRDCVLLRGWVVGPCLQVLCFLGIFALPILLGLWARGFVGCRDLWGQHRKWERAEMGKALEQHMLRETSIHDKQQHKA